MPTSKNGAAAVVSEPTNDGAEAISYGEPYIARVELEGVAPIIFHRWSDESVEEKSKAAKGSAAKKTDNIESYVWRNELEQICIPGEYLRGAIVNAAKFKQDPRSPRKSAMDLFKAGVIPMTLLAPILNQDGQVTQKWDYEDRRRVTIQRTSAITRVRPAFHPGWQATFELSVTLPEYIDRHLLLDVITMAGKVVGLADYRPTYGRFGVTHFEVMALE
jgi:hypothetical protein